MEKKQFYAFVIVLLLIGTFLIIRENYQQMQNAKMLEKITREQTEIMRHFGDRSANAEQVVNIGEEEVPLGAPTSPSDPAYEEVLTDCARRMVAISTTLVIEYTTEAANHGNDAEALHRLCVEKMSRLSEISAGGMTKMSAIRAKEESESPDAYRNWVRKLIAVYAQESEKVATAYRMSVK